MEQEIGKYKEALKKAAKKIEELSNKMHENDTNEDIAIIGYACRFPGGANDPEKFWDILSNGVDTVTEIKKSRFDYEKYYSDDMEEAGKMYTKNGAFLNVPVDEFDNRHFEISPIEANAMDPQQRLLLEVSWEALENAGLNIKRLQGSDTGVFVGVNSSDYFRAHMYSGDTKKINSYSVTGITFGAACGRLSYFYDFKGPAVTFDTACSSSLVALNAAIESLKKDECSIALVGGVNLLLTPESFIGLSKIHGLSKDGRCKAFDESADGFSRGEGCGVVVLKKMSRAKADGDTISAVVKGIFIGQDGRTNGITAPNGSAQQKVIRQALAQAHISTDDIDYVETHGTGTPLGDSIEAQVLGDIFKDKKNKLLIGSVKTNIAHLEAASAMAGLIKIILSFKHNQIPVSIHFNNKNPNIDWSNIEVVNKPFVWKRGQKLRRAGISAFGFTGTLAHAIIEEPPSDQGSEKVFELPYYLMALSAKSEEALKDTVCNMKDYLQKTDNSINDICYTSNICKSHLNHRFVVHGKSREDILNRLENYEKLQENLSAGTFKINNIVFLFTGQGSIYKDIAKTFYESSRVFKEALDSCNQKFNEILNISILDAIYGNEDNTLLDKAIYSQPVIFSIEYALTKVWDSLGIKAKAVVGHSIGEYAAACYAGILDLDDAIKMISYRGKIMDSINVDGKMVGILTDADSVREAIKESGCKNVSIAAINAPQNVTISGLRKEVDMVIEKIQEKQRVFVDKLNITHPFHSILMKEYCNEYYENIKAIECKRGKVDIISSITGELEDENTFGDINYWTNHLCNTVNYYKAVETAKEYGGNIFIEIGGDATLCGLANQCISDGEELFLPSLRKGVNGYKQLFESIGLLYLNGVELQWKSFYRGYKKEKVMLPNYAFSRKSFWTDLNSDIVNDIDAESAVSIAPEESIDLPPGTICENSIKPVSLIKAKKPSDINRDKKAIELDLKNNINILTGLTVDEINSNDNLFTLGFDSLLLMNFKKRIDAKYNISISLNDFFLKLNTVDAIANYIYNNMPEISEVFSEQQPEKSLSAAIYKNNGSIPYYANIEDQINNIHSQLEHILNMSRQGYDTKESAYNTYSRSEFPRINNAAMIFEEDSLSAEQKKFLDGFISRYNTKTKGSKAYVSKYKPIFSDWINSLNYRTTIKELIYPIVSKGSQGARFWDIDGNEYLDLAIGYGVHYFGHNPAFIKEAIKEQLDKGFEIGPQCELAGKVAELIKDLTGVERVAFCNTGSEAVMEALRIARACRKKEKIVKFSGSYHGTFDGVLTDTDDEGPYPTSPGTTYGNIKDTISLLYGSKESIEYIKENHKDIAAVLVEPVQSRKPGFVPKEFLKELRAVTEELGIILIFDEMVNGFRIQAGGAQAYFGIKADIVTYGKIVGGGLPIGIVAGKSKYIDAIDGGNWSFGDSSRPEKETIIFAGTFCKHPLSMASAYATLSYMKEKGDELQKAVNEKTKLFAEKANEFFQNENVPIRVRYFGSQFKFETYGKYDLALFPIEMELFFYLLSFKGIYTWERRTCCFCTEITDSDIKFILDKIRESICELRQGGFEFSDKASTENKVIPMSINQKRLFSTILINEGDPYNIIGALEIKGSINTLKLESVLKKIIERHESLRTCLYIRDNQFVQEVSEDTGFKINIIEKEGSKDLDELIQETISRFDLSEGSLFKVTLIRVSPGKEILLFDLHHTIADGRSLDILGQELIRLYSGEQPEPINSQYSDYVLWEESFLNSNEIKEAEVYWLGKLSGEIEKINLPADFNSNPIVSLSGNTVRMNIEEDLVNNLKQFSQKSGTTLFMVLAAAFNVLLYKLSGTKDIIIGTPVTNRGNGVFDNNIGMFTNTIVLRNQLSDKKRFKEFLNEVRQNSLEAYAYMNYPFNFLINKLNMESKSGSDRNPLFDVMFIYENIDKRLFKIDDIEIKTYEYKSKIAEFDFTLEILEESSMFNINLNYKTDILKQESVSKWGEYYRAILENIVKDSDIFISDIEIISEYDKKKIIYDFNATKADYPKDKTITQLFRKQAAKTPDEAAVIFGNDRITYSELDKKSNQLARVLRNKGVQADSIVGIMADRSIEMVIGIIGILKAGGAYLPIDINLPKNRINDMVEDSGLEVLIVSKVLNNDLKFGGSIVNVKDKDILKEDDSDIVMSNQSTDLAYLIYTSGSTGKPKGVMIEHQQVNNFVHGIIDKTVLGEYKNILCVTTISFDIFGLETLVPITQGMTIILASEEEAADGGKLAKVITENHVEVMQTTPSRYKMLLESDSFKKSIAGLKVALVGGEEVPKSLLKELNMYDGLKVYNVYGPTETTIWSTVKLVEDENTPTIGTPISNTQIYIVDNNNKIVPIGVPGELCIGGDGLARGYFNRQELTSEKFVVNPFEAGTRMYRTGDLARWLPSGEIEFLGRIDNQVKIRGFRIEVGEIESKLLNHENIRQAVVVAKEDKNKQKYLCAYAVCEKELNKTEIRDYLRESLPEYMVPSYFMQIDQMPLISSGKINRKALPEINIEGIITSEYEAPRDDIEQRLVELWCEILEIEKIGINDNFFDFGGHSLNATILVGRIHKELNVNVPVKELFKAKNIKELGKYIRLMDKTAYEEIERVEEKAFYKASSAQKRMYMSQEMNNSTVYNMSKAIEVLGKLDLDKLDRTMRQLIKRHEALRTSFEIVDQEIVQRVHPAEEVDFNVENIIVNSAQEISEKIEGFIKPFNLKNAPLIRVGIIKLEEQRNIIIFDVHHIISDGISVSILTNEFSVLYIDKALDPLKIQYKDYSDWQLKKMESLEVKKQEKFWLNEFSGKLPKAKLPTDYPSPARRDFKGDNIEFKLHKDITEKLKKLGQKTSTTLYMILLADLNILLSKYCQEEDIVVGTPIAGRTHRDLENVIGMFVNTLAIRSNVDKDLRFIEYLEAIKEKTLVAFDNQEYQFEELVQMVAANSDISQNSLFDVMFAVQNVNGNQMEIGKLTVHSYPLTEKTEKFNLTIECWEDSEELFVNISYATSLYKRETIEKISEYYKHIINLTADDTDVIIQAISLITKDELSNFYRNSEINDLNEEKLEFSF